MARKVQGHRAQKRWQEGTHDDDLAPDEEARFLSEVDVLEALTQEELDELACSLPDRRLEEGEYLYRPRYRADGLFALKWVRAAST